MAQVTLPKGIVAIHGRLGNMIYRTRKQADGTIKQFVYEYKGKKRREGMKGEGLEGMKGERREARG